MVGKDRNIARILTLFLLAAVLILPGCKTLQKVVPVPVAPDANALLIENITKATPEIRSLDVKKMSLAISMNGSNFNTPAICKVIADSLIQLTVMPFFGAEMFSAYISPTEILVIDKLKSIYYQLDYGDLQTRFNLNIDFNTLCSILLNRPFIAGKQTIGPTDFVQMKDPEAGLRMISEKTAFIQENFVGDDFRISKVSIKTKNQSHEFNAAYRDFLLQDGIVFPFTQSFGAKGERQSLSLKMTLSRVIFNESINIIMPELSLYRRANIENLLKQ